MRRTATFLFAVLAAAGSGGAEPPVPFEWTAMGTRVRLLVRGDGAGEAGPRMRDAARAALEAVEAETSAFRATSGVARVSAAAGNGEWVPVGPAFEAALDLSLDVARASGGAFNPLVAPLLEANGFPRGAAAAPSPEEAVAALDPGGIERRPGACRLARRGMALDFGGVAKGLGADRAARAARAVATNEFLLDVGGNLVGRGAWTVGVRDPRGGADAPPLRAFTLADGSAVATSGNYERFVERADGTRTGHLFDPRTGRPSDGGGALQATAMAPTAAEADAWSTALFVLGPEAGGAALAARPSVGALWAVADADGGVRLVGPHAAGGAQDSNGKR